MAEFLGTVVSFGAGKALRFDAAGVAALAVPTLPGPRRGRLAARFEPRGRLV